MGYITLGDMWIQITFRGRRSNISSVDTTGVTSVNFMTVD